MPEQQSKPATLNQKGNGYRGIWYMNQPSHDEYVFKYSGGLATYCAKHRPFAIYRPEVEKTFFCYGGTPRESHLRHMEEDLMNGHSFEREREGFLLHMVSYYDHRTGYVPRPTILLDKRTADAHDNPVIAMDDGGTVWVFSTSHGRSRPSCIHRSLRPYSIDAFEWVPATWVEEGQRVPLINFSYMQPWYVPGHGFIAFFTRYHDPAIRTIFCMTSPDGVQWSARTRLAAMDEGHYQVSEVWGGKAGTAFNYHPDGKGLNWRTNLYYMETPDIGASWLTVAGQQLNLPLVDPGSPALVHDYQSEGLNVYLKDIAYDHNGNPVILYVTSRGYKSGPEHAPRTWTTARWTGLAWDIQPVTTSDSNYDSGSLYIESDGLWRIIGPTAPGPQAYNPGGEMVMWCSPDQGAHWQAVRQLTTGSPRNHNYARRPVNAHPGFYALWADGHGRKPSKSLLYICTKGGNVRVLPEYMDEET
ncbi:MAG: BNR-4 repeat-containing protein [Anaerolineae bacterium]|nr:BNR-4 repeat-containing protein [Anaerolineae bacterium]